MQKLSFVSMVAGHMSEHTPLSFCLYRSVNSLKRKLASPLTYSEVLGAPEEDSRLALSQFVEPVSWKILPLHHVEIKGS